MRLKWPRHFLFLAPDWWMGTAGSSKHETSLKIPIILRWILKPPDVGREETKNIPDSVNKQEARVTALPIQKAFTLSGEITFPSAEY